ncbi:hypothetical protein ACFY12_26205 [Streptomyces sp. NPDC001339]|uniref:hypothetical protein n=1 Tax=Streptomyces sp. NPDC001339 TaxID=3364563 RepID=UPI00369A6FB3
MVCERRQMNAFLVGSVAVRLVIVNGPPGTSAAFTPDEIARIRAFSLRGLAILSVLAARQPTRPRLSWRLNFSVESISQPPLPLNQNPTTSGDVESREAPWRDAVLRKLVGDTGPTGLRRLRAASIGGADHAVIVLWTRYEAAWLAYAQDDEAKLIMCWPLWDMARTNHSLSEAPRALAHEICHLFGAPDEYRRSQCTVLREDDGSGVGGCGFGNLDFPNFNCALVNPRPVPCLMAANTSREICPATVAHLGWVDSNQDGVLDVFQ